MADIPHTGNGPRIHDFRHGLAVACLKKWSLAGEDLTNLLPYLAAYMGTFGFQGDTVLSPSYRRALSGDRQDDGGSIS